MGTLVVKHYRTVLFAKLADHTYVECDTGGKAWSCWGGKTGGTVLRQGPGSTARANCIAKPNEKAGIRCYLINGVCHQAANRILLPAQITCRGARGYQVSSTLFGTYGHVGIWPCRSPFDQCSGVAGDLPECETPTAPAALSSADSLEWRQTLQVLALYQSNADLFAAPDTGADRLRGSYVQPAERVTAFHRALFENHLGFRLGAMLTGPLRDRLVGTFLTHLDERVEVQREYALGNVSPREYADRFDELTLQFQAQAADGMTDDEYEALFELPRGQAVTLADPGIVETMSIE